MANAFSKEERVAFEQLLDGFNDQLVLSSVVSKYRTNPQQMERTSDVMWRPMPYIAQSFTGSDATTNFTDATQLSVPATIDTQKYSTAILTATELRDALQEQRLGTAAAQKLASDVNVSVLDAIANKATIVVAKSAAATGYVDVADIDTVMNEQGIMMNDRYLALSSGSYNAMAANLAARETMNQMPTEAYRRSYVGQVAGFQTFKMDYSDNLTAAAATTVTVRGADQRYDPKATDTNGHNVDNRTMSLDLSVTANDIKVGDCFTIANVFAIHHITKRSTGELKTFRVVGVTQATGDAIVEISPPIIATDGTDPTVGMTLYKNVDSTPTDGAAVTFLNAQTKKVNPFWHRDAVELLPGTLAIPADAGAAIMRGTTDQGIEMTMQKQFDINTQKTKYRWDIRYGVNITQPEMCGIILFDQGS